MLILGRRNKQLSQVAACHGQEGIPSSIRHPTLRSPRHFANCIHCPHQSCRQSQVLASSTQRAVGQSDVKANDWALGLSKGGDWEARGVGSICPRWPLSGTTSDVGPSRSKMLKEFSSQHGLIRPPMPKILYSQRPSMSLLHTTPSFLLPSLNNAPCGGFSWLSTSCSIFSLVLSAAIRCSYSFSLSIFLSLSTMAA
jgi:hypothetical protein